MKVLIELPDNWLDADLMGNLDWITKTVRQEVKTQVVKALTEQVELPKLTVTKDELRPLVVKALAEKQADALWDK